MRAQALSAIRHEVAPSVLVAVACSTGCAVILHGVARPSAVWIIPLAWAWGATVLRRPPAAMAPWWVLFAVAVAVRAPLIGCPPVLSDDLYRYLWEGLASSAGHDVFREAPAAIRGLDDALQAQVNHPDVPSVYPPLALWWFRFLALGHRAAFVQACTALVDALVPVAIASGARRSRAAWIYALHPVAVIESAAGGHVDLPAIALAACAIAAWRRERPGPAFLLAVAGGMTKLLPLVWAPTLLRGQPARVIAGWVAAAIVLAALVSAPFLPDRWPEGLLAYTTRWEFDGLVYPWIAAPLGAWARPLLVGVGALACAAALRQRDPAAAWSTVGTAFVCLSPTVHPWYTLWAVVPDLLCDRTRWAWASLALFGSYAVLATFDPATGTWAEAPWLWWATWPPALLLWAVGERLSPR